MHRVQLEAAFVLHSFAYRNTSLIVDLLTRHHGRVAVVARSARGQQSRFQGRLQSFVPLLVSYGGRHELKNLSHVELSAKPYEVSGSTMMCAFYLNELLVRLLPKEEACPALFQLYEETLLRLQQDKQIELHLRIFEKNLLSHLGYGLLLTEEAITRAPIVHDAYYQYDIECGFRRVSGRLAGTLVCRGDSILALHNEILTSDQQRQDIKRLMRQVIAHYLNGRPLKSRDLI